MTGRVRTAYAHLFHEHRVGAVLHRPTHLTGPGALARPPADRRPVRAALLLLSVLLGAAVLAGRDRGPAGLDEADLVGPRGPGCVRLVVAADQSGSMTQYAGARDAAMRALLPWAERELRPDDEVAMIDWAATAVTTLPPTPVAHLGGVNVPDGAVDSRGTSLTPVVKVVGALAPASRCRVHLVLLSDGITSDAASAAARGPLSAASVDEVSLLMPSKSMRSPADFSAAFPYATAHGFDGHSADATGLAIANAVARSTGQQVHRAH